ITPLITPSSPARTAQPRMRERLSMPSGSLKTAFQPGSAGVSCSIRTEGILRAGRRHVECAPDMTGPFERIATAPTSWGLCEVPAGGGQLPPERVLPEMRELGFQATEAGPDGFLGTTADEIRTQLGRHRLRLIGGFLPLVLHDPAARAESLATARR